MGKGNRTRNNNYGDAYEMSASGAAVKSAKKAQKGNHSALIITISIVALIALCLGFVLFNASGCEGRMTTVVSSDNYEVSANMLTFYQGAKYMNAYVYYLQMYAQYFGDSMDFSSYADSAARSEATFTSAVNSAREILVLCEKAKADGISLTDTDKNDIKEALESYGNNFAAMFGTGITKSDARKMLELEALAGKYADKYVEEKTNAITDDDITKYIEDHKADFYKSHFLKFDISLITEDYKDLDDQLKEATALAEKYMDLLEKTKSEDEFKRQVINYILERDFDQVAATELGEEIRDDAEKLATVKKTIGDNLFTMLVKGETVENDDTIKAAQDALNTTCSEALNALAGEQAYTESGDEAALWLVNDSTAQYATKVVKTASDEEYKASAYMLTETLHMEDLETVNIGHILIDAEVGVATDEEMAAAKKEAEEILATFLAGEQTREAFEELGIGKTDDANVFYDGVTAGKMTKEFDAWIFDEARKHGDTDIVKTVYGYHVMYFDEKGDNTATASAKSGIVNDQYTAMIEEGAKSLTLNEKYIAANTEETNNG